MASKRADVQVGDMPEADREQMSVEAPPPLRRQMFNARTALGLIAAGVIIYIFLTQFDLHEAWAALQRMQLLYFAAAGVVYYASVPLRSRRWRILLDSAGYRVPVGRLTVYYMLAWFLNAILPSRIGDLYRAYLPRKHHDVPYSASLGVLVSEKVIDLAVTACLVVVSGAFYWTQLSAYENVGYVYWAIGAIGVLVVAFVGLVFVLPTVVSRMSGAWKARLALFHSGLFHDSRRFPDVFASTVLIWGSEALRLYLVCLALGIPVGFLVALFISQAALILMAIPLSPAGLGIVELLMLTAFSFIQIDASLAGAITIADRLVSHWSLILIGGLCFIVSSRLR